MTESFDGGIDADFFGLTDVGCTRRTNEDRFIADRIGNTNFILAAAIDGLGGYSGGEFAAELTARKLGEFLGMTVTNGADPAMALHQAFINANNTVVEHREADVRVSQMGCVAVAALFSMADRKVYMANCGDARIYRYADGRLTKLSHDQSPVGRLEDSGELSEAEAMAHPRRNIVDHCMGLQTVTTDSHDFIETATFPLVAGSEKYLLCSDGLSDMLTSAEIAETLASDSTAEEIATALIEKAKQAGGRDNVTAVVVDLTIADEPAATPDCPAANETKEKKPRRTIKLPRLPRKALLIAAWVIFLAALTAIVVLGIRRFTREEYPDNGEQFVKDSTTVFVMVDNELDSIEVDTISRVVLQARDSARVDIPR